VKPVPRVSGKVRLQVDAHTCVLGAATTGFDERFHVGVSTKRASERQLVFFEYLNAGRRLRASILRHDRCVECDVNVPRSQVETLTA
jgi:hypothetical protein